MKFRNQCRKYGAKAAAGVSALGLMLQNALAATPVEVTDAVAAGKTDASSIGWLVFGLLILIAIIRHSRKTL